jgi:hypothetical protein
VTSHPVQLVTRPPLSIEKLPIDVSVKPGQPFNLTCQTNDPERSRIYWFFNGIPNNHSSVMQTQKYRSFLKGESVKLG